ncbi:MAG: hypothetical protein ACJAQ3_002454, partial [Planctomycetota bacterium]
MLLYIVRRGRNLWHPATKPSSHPIVGASERTPDRLAKEPLGLGKSRGLCSSTGDHVGNLGDARLPDQDHDPGPRPALFDFLLHLQVTAGPRCNRRKVGHAEHLMMGSQHFQVASHFGTQTPPY